MGGQEWKRQQNVEIAQERDRAIAAQQRQIENSLTLQKKALETSEYISEEARGRRSRVAEAELGLKETQAAKAEAEYNTYQEEAPLREVTREADIATTRERKKTAPLMGKAARKKIERTLQQDMRGMALDDLQYIAAAAATVGADPESFGQFQSIMSDAGIDLADWGLDGEYDRVPINRLMQLREMAINSIDFQQREELARQTADAALRQATAIEGMKTGKPSKEIQIYDTLKAELGPEIARLYLRDIAVGADQMGAKEFHTTATEQAYTAIVQKLITDQPELQEVLASTDTEDAQAVMLQTQIQAIADRVANNALVLIAQNPDSRTNPVILSQIVANLPTLQVNANGEAFVVTQPKQSPVNPAPAQAPTPYSQLD